MLNNPYSSHCYVAVAVFSQENSALKDFTLLSEWDKNWKASLQRMNALDISLYEEAQLIAAQQLRAHGLSLERRTRGLAASMPAQV